MKTTLLLCCAMVLCAWYPLQAQEAEPSRSSDQQLSQYARELHQLSASGISIKESEDQSAIRSTYDQLATNTLSLDDKRKLYALIIDRVVQDQLVPEVKVLYLYLIEQQDKTAAEPLYKLDRNAVLAAAAEGMAASFPDLDRAGRMNLAPEHQMTLVREALDELKTKGIPINTLLALFE